MPHLGADVAAFVDGQLSDQATRDALEHLQECDECARAVRQQRVLKSRMSSVATPEPPPDLVASLSGLATEPPAEDGWWTRLRRSVPLRAGLVLVSTSFAVVVTAYVVGGAEQRLGDEITPPFDQYAADFHGPATVRTGNTIAASAMAELDGAGWPCHPTLAGDLHRTSGVLTKRGGVVALTYTNGTVRLNLFEQNGALDRDGLEGFRAVRWGDAQVWVREGVPMLVTWDDDGVVYTIVTDADRARVARAVAELPNRVHEQAPAQRVRDGLARMTAWLDAA